MAATGTLQHTVLVTEDVVGKFEVWRKRGVRFHHPPQTTLWLIDTVRRNRELAPQPMLSAIVDEVRKFSLHEQHDDITMIIAKCRDG